MSTIEGFHCIYMYLFYLHAVEQITNFSKTAHKRLPAYKFLCYKRLTQRSADTTRSMTSQLNQLIRSKVHLFMCDKHSCHGSSISGASRPVKRGAASYSVHQDRSARTAGVFTHNRGGNLLSWNHKRHFL